MTPDERAEIARDFPDHWFCRVVNAHASALIAIPKAAKGDVEIPNSGGDKWPVETLHGATINLGGTT
jgi:hypothetical protein